ncbi:MAG: carbohydrate binding family 9 domain-containing protein [Acidobacteria bacterium]|nr:carbohydrate binding family 9 domain-containing protein [Acidobacteriota bacterium]
MRSELPVILDGNMDEPAWREAPVFLGFIQKDPLEGQPSTERTEFRVLYTATTLYIGVICYDTNPAGILASERRRDNTLDNDDSVTLVLDTFHDHRNGFLFRTNPLGAQYDALITDEGKEVNANWDEKWEVAAQAGPAGWIAEFAIPFKSLRLLEGNGQLWGLDLERIIRRKNEQSYWNNYRRGFTLQNLSQGGHLQGLENIETGMRLRVKPYFLGGFNRSSNDFKTGWENAADVGMEVMKYRITPSLTADLTWNTDFAQTEVDNQQVNLDRFPLFFPEKREFFLEGAGVYDFGQVRNEGTRDLTLFHSRSIGLTPSRQPVPITAGARVTGNVKGVTLGLLNVQTDSEEDLNVPESNYSVARFKRNVLARSNFGGFLLSREMGGSGDFNRVLGFDANFVFHRFLKVAGLWAKSYERANPNQDWTSYGSVMWESDSLIAGMSYMFIEPNFRDDLGFVPRPNMRRFSEQLGFFPRPKSDFIRRLTLRTQVDYTTDRNWHLESRRNHFTFDVDFQNGDSIGASPHYRFERLAKPEVFRKRVIEVTPDGKRREENLIVIPPGDYGWWYSRFSYTLNPSRRLSGTFTFEPSPGYFGGRLTEWNFSPRLKVSNNLSFDLQYIINDATFGETDFLDHVVNLRANYNFNNQWLTTTTIQYNNADAFTGLNFRLNYIFRPGDDFFLVYNEGRRQGEVFRGQIDRSLQVKLTYSFDF